LPDVGLGGRKRGRLSHRCFQNFENREFPEEAKREKSFRPVLCTSATLGKAVRFHYLKIYLT
jgi:hypothetical protein